MLSNHPLSRSLAIQPAEKRLPYRRKTRKSGVDSGVFSTSLPRFRLSRVRPPGAREFFLWHFASLCYTLPHMASKYTPSKTLVTPRNGESLDPEEMVNVTVYMKRKFWLMTDQKRAHLSRGAFFARHLPDMPSIIVSDGPAAVSPTTPQQKAQPAKKAARKPKKNPASSRKTQPLEPAKATSKGVSRKTPRKSKGRLAPKGER